MFAKPVAFGDPTFGSVNSSREYFMSCAVTGFPSCHLARGSIENAIDSESVRPGPALREPRLKALVAGGVQLGPDLGEPVEDHVLNRVSGLVADQRRQELGRVADLCDDERPAAGAARRRALPFRARGQKDESRGAAELSRVHE